MGLLSWLRSLLFLPPEERRRLPLDPALLDAPEHGPEGLREEVCPAGHEGVDADPCRDDPATYE